MKKIFFLFMLICSVFMVSLYTQTQPRVDQTYPKQIEYAEGESMFSFIQKLKTAQVIKNETIAKTLFIIQGVDRSVKPGIYTFTKPLTVFEVVNKIASDSVQTKGIKVVIPEGSTVAEINTILNTAFAGKKMFTIDTAYEGYLFPDTYFFSVNSNEESVIEKLTSTWEIKTAELFQNMPEPEIKKIVIMASILEKEGKSKTEREMISGILWKRLAEGMPLQVDATFLYTLGKGSSELTLNDLQTDTPYNTYTNKGLPIGAINNPGLETLRAALNPKESLFYFYLHDSRGQIYYGKTFDQHKKNKALYLR